jgi:hypothetical protein
MTLTEVVLKTTTVIFSAHVTQNTSTLHPDASQTPLPSTSLPIDTSFPWNSLSNVTVPDFTPGPHPTRTPSTVWKTTTVTQGLPYVTASGETTPIAGANMVLQNQKLYGLGLVVAVGILI